MTCLLGHDQPRPRCRNCQRAGLVPYPADMPPAGAPVAGATSAITPARPRRCTHLPTIPAERFGGCWRSDGYDCPAVGRRVTPAVDCETCRLYAADD